MRLKKNHNVRSEGIYCLHDNMVIVGYIKENTAKNFSCKKLDKYSIVGKNVLYDEELVYSTKHNESKLMDYILTIKSPRLFEGFFFPSRIFSFFIITQNFCIY